MYNLIMHKEFQKRPFIYRGDAFDADFAEYHFSEYEVMEKFHKNIREKKFKVSDTDVKYRVINHWEEKGLLPDKLRKDSEGWRRFSIVEFIWLKVIEQLRSFGVPIDTIKETKERIMWMDKEGEIYPLFEYYVAKARASTADPYVVITQDGLSDLGTLGEIETIKLLYGNQSYILISLKNIMEKLCLKVTKPKMLFSLNKNESEILEIIRSEDVDSFKVEMKDGKINNIVTDKVFPGIDLARLTKEMEKSGSYFDITAKYEKGKAQSVKVSLKRKM